ncbi:MAG: SUMF1/EgtB/PvdO family nonheme iron enzyme [Corynebacteriales bacterium]|nr:SUMF1/EgtB/PvdO family nonheme iron enzyme [Mycobacteriales bacterium]
MRYPVTVSKEDSEYWEGIEEVINGFAKLDEDSALNKLVELAANHREWPVRAAALEQLATQFPEEKAAHRAIAAGTHDPVDWVAFTAIRLCGEHGISNAARDLIGISGWPSNFTQPGYARKPVGVGAALTKRALLSIFESDEPVELRRREDAHFAELRGKIAAAKRPVRAVDVVHIPAGPFVAGATITEIGPFQMDETDNPLRAVDVPAFLIDRTTVTNARYAEFLADTENNAEFDHPDQPIGANHTPAHWHDPRFNAPENPVVGIDWYDAWAFARWAGGLLPSEDQWEKAARGLDGRTFPWGNEWDPAKAQYVERSFGSRVNNLAELERVLTTVSTDKVPERPVLSADDLPAGASPFGLLQMAGNVWEMTRTNFFTRRDMDPFFRGRTPVEFMNREEAFYVLRGGTWTSPPVCLTTYYRGKDLLTDKHNEIGFRCVYPA